MDRKRPADKIVVQHLTKRFGAQTAVDALTSELVAAIAVYVSLRASISAARWPPTE